MSDSKKLVQAEETLIVRNGIEEKGINVKCVGDAEILRRRMCNDWMRTRWHAGCDYFWGLLRMW